MDGYVHMKQLEVFLSDSNNFLSEINNKPLQGNRLNDKEYLQLKAEYVRAVITANKIFDYNKKLLSELEKMKKDVSEVM